MIEPVSMYDPGRQYAAVDDKVDVAWWFKDLMLSYKYGEKFRFKRALDKLGPYLDEKLLSFFQEIYEDSLWTNPITGKKGF